MTENLKEKKTNKVYEENLPVSTDTPLTRLLNFRPIIFSLLGILQDKYLAQLMQW